MGVPLFRVCCLTSLYHKDNGLWRLVSVKEMCCASFSTSRPGDKIAATLQRTFSNTFSWQNNVTLWLKFHRSLFLPDDLFHNRIALLLMILSSVSVPSHYLNKWWPTLSVHICVTRPQSFNITLGLWSFHAGYGHNSILYTWKNWCIGKKFKEFKICLRWNKEAVNGDKNTRYLYKYKNARETWPNCRPALCKVMITQVHLRIKLKH